MPKQHHNLRTTKLATRTHEQIGSVTVDVASIVTTPPGGDAVELLLEGKNAKNSKIYVRFVVNSTPLIAPEKARKDRIDGGESVEGGKAHREVLHQFLIRM